MTGSGLAGSLMAIIARRLGRSVLLLGELPQPAFNRGVSGISLGNVLLEELSRTYNLPGLYALANWENWRRAHPETAAGIRRGFSFYHHPWGHPFESGPDHANQLLVEDSPSAEEAAVHWYPPELESWLHQEALNAGVDFLDHVRIQSLSWSGDAANLSCEHQGTPRVFRARFLVDASNGRRFLQPALGLRISTFASMPSMHGVHNYFRDIQPAPELAWPAGASAPPYPQEESVAHHIFEGGWVWVMKYSNGLLNAGATLNDPQNRRMRLQDGPAGWHRLLAQFPTLQKHLSAASPQLPYVYSSKLSCRTETLSGPRWVLLPCSAGFQDPFLWSSLPLNLLCIGRLAELFAHDWGKSRFEARLGELARQSHQEISATAQLVTSLYACSRDFPLFGRLLLLYFGALRYTATFHRLGRPDLGGGFLLADRPEFSSAMRQLCQKIVGTSIKGGFSSDAREEVMTDILETLRPFDVGDYRQPKVHNWFPDQLNNLQEVTARLGLGKKETRRLLTRSRSKVQFGLNTDWQKSGWQG